MRGKIGSHEILNEINKLRYLLYTCVHSSFDVVNFPLNIHLLKNTYENLLVRRNISGN